MKHITTTSKELLFLCSRIIINTNQYNYNYKYKMHAPCTPIAKIFSRKTFDRMNISEFRCIVLVNDTLLCLLSIKHVEFKLIAQFLGT